MHPGRIVRVGDTVRRPPGAPVVAELLLHLETAGFDRAPRFLGHDERGREVLSFVEGEVMHAPDWQHDDEANARRLRELAGWFDELHQATAHFDPEPGLAPIRPLACTGTTWTHGDVGYGNAVYRRGRLVACIDWEFAAPAALLHDVGALLGTATRAPRPDVGDNDRRRRAVALALDALCDGYGLVDADRRRLPMIAAAVLDDAAAFTEAQRFEQPAAAAAMRWRAEWFRSLTAPA